MLNKTKITKIDLTTMDNALIYSTEKNFSFPQMFEEDDNAPGSIETIMMKGKNLPEIDMNCTIIVIIHLKSGDRVKYTGTVTMSSEFQMNIQIQDDAANFMEERRRYYKVKTEFVCKVPFITRQDRIVRFANSETVYVKDFNIGGVFLVTSKIKLIQNDIVMLMIPIFDEVIEVPTKVLRVQKDKAENIVGYGCQFINTTPYMEEVFAKFVNTMQIEELKKERDKQAVWEELERRQTVE